MRIVLVNPPPRGELEKHWAEYPILGLSYVAAALRAAGHEITLLDGKLAGLTAAAITEAALAARPGLVGITCMTVEYPIAAGIARDIRQRSSVPIALGGAHINAVGTAALDECPAADYACLGEGEHLAVELAAAIAGDGDVSRIPGLAYRRDGQVVKNAAREYHDDYDALPFPAWDLFEVRDQLPLLTHRGCPFECNFCGHNSGFQPRYRSPENVLAEIEHIVERYHPRTIRIEDETFGLNLPRTTRILEGVLARGLDKRVSFSAQTRVDRVDRDFIRLLKRCNFQTLELGVESGSPPVLARMGKGITVEQVERAVAHAKAEDLRVWCKFILGHPHETEEDILATARFIARINPDRLSVSLMTPFPGTPIFDMAVRGEGGYRLLSDDWSAFDKYRSGALELESVSLTRLKLLQLYCYLNLYLQNGRVTDLVKLAWGHAPLVAEVLMGVVSAPRQRRQAASPGSARRAPLATADVASPDATLVQLRRRAAARGGNPEDPRSVRSWAAPGSK